MSRIGRLVIKSLSEGKDTWSLYKNKSIFYRLYMVVYTMDILDGMFDFYYFVRNFVANIARLIEYAPVVWRHRNWDYGMLFTFQKKLYQDLYKGCYVNGNHVYKKSQAKKLKTIIGLLERLEADDYCNWQYDYLEKKYGDNDFIFTPIEGSTCSRLTFSRDERMTKEQKASYIKERAAIWALQEAQEKQDIQLLHKLIEKNYKKFWD